MEIQVIPHLSIRSLRKEDDKIKQEWEKAISQCLKNT